MRSLTHVNIWWSTLHVSRTAVWLLTHIDRQARWKQYQLSLSRLIISWNGQSFKKIVAKIKHIVEYGIRKGSLKETKNDEIIVIRQQMLQIQQTELNVTYASAWLTCISTYSSVSAFRSAFWLYRLCTKVHALGEAQLFIRPVAGGCGTVVEVCESRQRQNVATGDAEDGQLGQSLVVRVRRHGAS